MAERGLSWRKLAELTGYHPSWLSKIRNGRKPSAEVVQRCDEVLGANGRLVALAEANELHPAHLPAPPAGFVGRDTELRRLRAALTSDGRAGAPAIVAIDGPPGVGKSATALRGTHELRGSGTWAYTDGQLFANLNGHSPDKDPASPEDVLEEFLVALGIPAGFVPSGLELRAKLYRTLLDSRKVLIVLDNAASSQQVEPLLPGSAGCGVIVTSRRRLAGLAMRADVTRIVLAPMTPRESVALLAMLIGSPRAESERASIRALADRCGHLPLALRIAAERVTAHPYRAVGDLVDELSVEGRSLEALVTDDSVAVQTVFEWSYRNLSGAEARVFRLLGLMRGSVISTEMASVLTGMAQVPAQRLLESLAGWHLLETAPGGHYRLHRLLRVYAAVRARAEESPDDLGASVCRLVGWYLDTASAGGRMLAPFHTSPLAPAEAPDDDGPPRFDGYRAALNWFDTEAPNFVPILELAIEYRLHESAWRLADALWDYFRLMREPVRFWETIQQLGLQAARADGDHRAEGWLRATLAEAYRWAYRYDRSRRLFDQALAINQEAGNRNAEAWTLTGAGFLAIDEGWFDRAYSCATRAGKIFDALGDRFGLAATLLTTADANDGWQRPDEALPALREALKIFQEIGDRNGEALALVKMADIFDAKGEHDRALEYLDRSLQARRLAGSRRGEADGHYRRGCILHALGRTPEAETSWSTALTLYDEVDDPRAANLRLCLDGRDYGLMRKVLAKPTL